MKYLPMCFYYLYAIVLIVGTAYLTFYKKINEGWWIMTLILLSYTPKIESRNTIE